MKRWWMAGWVCALSLAGCEAQKERVRLVGPPPIAPFNPTAGRLAWQGSPVPPPPRQEAPVQVAPLVPARSAARPAAPAGETSWNPPFWSKRWKYIIVHHSANPDSGSWETIDYAHRARGWDELGYHFVIGNGIGNAHGDWQGDGEIHVGGRWTAQKHGAHTRLKPGDDNGYNEHGIGICLIGNFEREAPTQKQLDAAIKLTAFLANRAHIPLANIDRHLGVDRTECPGRLFPWAEFRRRLAAQLSPAP